MLRPLTSLAIAASLIAPTMITSGAVAAKRAAPAVSEAFGNTIVSTYPDGRTGKLWIKADGTYAAQGRRHDPSSGRWNVSGAKLCLRQSKPMSVPIHFCTPIPEGGMGHAWSAKAVSGEDIRVQLVKGHA